MDEPCTCDDTIGLIYAVDFDRTLHSGGLSNMGAPNIKLIEFLLDKQKNYGAKLILWSCRCGKDLRDAIDWCRNYNLYFDAVNDNLPETILRFGENTRKVNADRYIDDKNYYPNDDIL